MLDLWGMLEEMGLAVAVICLKARQHGISTLTEMAVAHRIQFKRDVNAIVGSSDPTKSEMMSKMMETCWANQPWWMMPSRTVDRRGSLIEFGGMNSGVSIQHGSQFTGIGRGTTPSTVHLSEVASFENPEELIDASLMGAFHESPDRFIVLESTAEGNSGYWFDTWNVAVNSWPKTLFYPVFIPWFVATNLYPAAAELKRNPVPANWEPATLTLTHKQKAELYVASRPELRKHLGKDWALSKEKMWWWECTREAYKAKKELNLFLQEFTSDPDESFQSTNISAFDADLIAELRDATKSKPPVAVYSIAGATISDRLVADARDADNSKEPIAVRAHWDHSIPPLDYELYPLKFRSYAEDPMDRLYVWEPPQPNIKYVLGVDTSDGVGQDRSIVQVLRLKNPFDPNDFDEQVAEFASPFVNSRDLWPIVLAIATWYSTPQNGKLEQNRVVIECNGNGETVQHEIRKLGWWNFHPWEHYDNKRASQSNKIGWFTNVRTRSMAVDTLVSSIRDGWLKIRSPWFVQEMQQFERDEGRQSLRACFLPETPVVMADGSRKPISTVSIGEQVLTVDGTSQTILAKERRPWRTHVVELNIMGVPELVTSTPDHRYLVRPRTTSFQLQSRLMRKDFPTCWMPAERIRSGDWLCVPKRLGLKPCGLTDEQLWAVGFWLAEGNFIHDPYGQVSALQITNTDERMVDRFLSAMQSWFPENTISVNQFGGKKTIPTRIYKKGRERQGDWKTCYDAMFYHRTAAEMFLRDFGVLCDGKRLSPDFFMQSGLLPLVSGFIDGDGSQRKNKQHDVNLTTTSEVLAWQLRQIMLDSGVWCTIAFGDPRLGVKRKLRQWTLNVKASFLDKFYRCKVVPSKQRHTQHVMQDETAFWTPVRGVRTYKKNALVYDLTISENHTYNVNGVIVHNCYGAHDDRLMSCAFALCSSYIHEITTDGRTFYSHQRKRMSAKGEKQLQGLSQAQLTAQWLKEQGTGKKPYSGNYSPY